jgi:hypothetical protein
MTRTSHSLLLYLTAIVLVLALCATARAQYGCNGGFSNGFSYSYGAQSYGAPYFGPQYSYGNYGYYPQPGYQPYYNHNHHWQPYQQAQYQQPYSIYRPFLSPQLNVGIGRGNYGGG